MLYAVAARLTRNASRDDLSATQRAGLSLPPAQPGDGLEQGGGRLFVRLDLSVAAERSLQASPLRQLLDR